MTTVYFEPRKNCGRLDDHDPHLWPGHWLTEKVDYFCPGHIVVEGGHWGVRDS